MNCTNLELLQSGLPQIGPEYSRRWLNLRYEKRSQCNEKQHKPHNFVFFALTQPHTSFMSSLQNGKQPAESFLSFQRVLHLTGIRKTPTKDSKPLRRPVRRVLQTHRQKLRRDPLSFYTTAEASEETPGNLGLSLTPPTGKAATASCTAHHQNRKEAVVRESLNLSSHTLLQRHAHRDRQVSPDAQTLSWQGKTHSEVWCDV
mmetsp:Transcript_19782/g.39827  ORF Transcript_19782/g.39827 Transcript_19782/m.39827 type:complete len:202 (+) Transcript_19782:56-661(+)